MVDICELVWSNEVSGVRNDDERIPLSIATFVTVGGVFDNGPLGNTNEESLYSVSMMILEVVASSYCRRRLQC